MIGLSPDTTNAYNRCHVFPKIEKHSACMVLSFDSYFTPKFQCFCIGYSLLERILLKNFHLEVNYSLLAKEKLDDC